MEKVKTSLVVMAAGIGSRFGGGIKQLEPVGPNGEIIMDYSIHDALEAGFDRVVFIIRKAIEKDFKEIIGDRIAKICEIAYVYQENSVIPQGISVPEGRTKPFGTGHAALCCKGTVNEPFAIINADDYYGKECFKIVHDYLVETAAETAPVRFCMAGFYVKNTLSENGGVSRGLCRVDSENYLTEVTETHNIVPNGDGVAVKTEEGLVPISPESYASMNMWGLTPAFFDRTAAGFEEFLKNLAADDIKSEFYLPRAVDTMLKEGLATVRVLPTGEKWFGVTYREDKPGVMAAFKKLYADGVYSGKLF
ncbi:MAG: nucleotidyltransferase [Clostridia bacterium]|nr:nucleotidyltransferase [Clostridia bacterium]